MTLDLTTRYLGLTLKNPLVVGSCPLNYELDAARRNEDAGAAAIVVPPLHSDRLEAVQTGLAAVMDGPAEGFAEALDYFPDNELDLGPDEHLERIRALKEALEIPVIATLSGSLDSPWETYAALLADTGADAVELNLGIVPADPTLEAATVEDRLLDVVARVNAHTNQPLAIKLPRWFTSLANFAARLEEAGAEGLTLFRRFQEAWIDAEELELRLEYPRTSRADLPLRIRWLAILSAQRSLDLAISGGVHSAGDAVGALMAGASAVQVVDEVLDKGAGRITEMRDELTAWLNDNEYTAVAELVGCMNIERCPDPTRYLQRDPVVELGRQWVHRH